MGLHRAWPDAEIVGIDIKPQPRYPFKFIQGDWSTHVYRAFESDFIWASPPCQAHTALRTMWNSKPHDDFVSATRDALLRINRPWVIENVPGAPLYNPVKLCGSMFGLGCTNPVAELRRHRLFEASFPVTPMECSHHRNRKRRTIGIHGEGCRDARRKNDRGIQDFTVRHGREAMQIDWMTIAELCEAIPPAYSEYIARQFDAARLPKAMHRE